MTLSGATAFGQDVASSVRDTSKPADRAQKTGTAQWNIGAVMIDASHWHRERCGYYIAVWEKHGATQMKDLRSLEM